VQCILLLDGVIKYAVPTNQADIKNVFAISKAASVDCILSFYVCILEEETETIVNDQITQK